MTSERGSSRAGIEGEFIVFRVTLLSIVVVLLAGCVSSKKPTTTQSRTQTTPKASEPAKKPVKETPSVPPPTIPQTSNNDEEIKIILDLADKSKWDEAETRAAVLFEK